MKLYYPLISHTKFSRSLSNQTKSSIKVITDSSGITQVILNTPNKLNSLDINMFESLSKTAKSLHKDTYTRVVILRGEGRAFCTGLDMKSVFTDGGIIKNLNHLLNRPSCYKEANINETEQEIQVLEYKDTDQITENKKYENRTRVNQKYFSGIGNLAQDAALLWRDMPIPVLCTLHGMCYGGGLQIALGADMRYSTPDCKISIMESRWGLIPDMSGSITMRELMKMDDMKELTMSGRLIRGIEAHKLGLVTRVVKNPLKEAFKLSRKLIQRDRDSLTMVKKIFQETWIKERIECRKIEENYQRNLLKKWSERKRLEN